MKNQEPRVAIICFDVLEDAIADFISNQKYENVEIVRWSSTEDTYTELIEYLKETRCEYVCFYLLGQEYKKYTIKNMVRFLEKENSSDMVIVQRNIIDEKGRIVAHPDFAYQNVLSDTVVNGRIFLEYNIANKINLYGNLATIMCKSKVIKEMSWTVPEYLTHEICRLDILFQMIMNSTVEFIMTDRVNTLMEEKKENKKKILIDYQKLLLKYGFSEYQVEQRDYSDIKKEITFFYIDTGEYFNLLPIAEEAIKRGFDVKFTENIQEKAEIGVYCQHVCYPQNSKMSLVLLHDMLQGHNRWPNIWEIERWDSFDIGILPGNYWAEMWKKCSSIYYTRPRVGVYEFGYPKSDTAVCEESKQRAEKIKEELNFKYDYTVLYAPSWENDGKEDDFVKALSSLKVNLLIKQSSWPKEYQEIIDNIRQMRELHEKAFDNIYYIEPEESIMSALYICDLVVSDESSVMTEALLYNKPSIAIVDWLIPDTTPSRLSCVPIDYVIKCKKSELRKYVEAVIENPLAFEYILTKGQTFFSNVGTCCENIMNLIDALLENNVENDEKKKSIISKYRIQEDDSRCSMWI